MHKSLNFVVSNPGSKPRHRRNISSGFYPFRVQSKPIEHGSLLQHQTYQKYKDDRSRQKSPIQQLECEEASNFNVDDIDEAYSQCIINEDMSEYQSKNLDPAVYSAKYSYKSYLERDSMAPNNVVDTEEKPQHQGYKTYELR